MNSFKYFKEKNISKIILGLLIIINLIVVAVGFIVLYYFSGNESKNISDTVWDSFKILFDPASVLALKFSALVRVIVALLVLIGIVTFTGGAIGYVTNLITDSITNSREGNKGVFIDGATLFLNWNECAMDIIIDHLCDKTRDAKEDYIVILSQEDKISLENEIKDRIKHFKQSTTVSYNKKEPKIIVRTGNPESGSDLLYKVNWISCAPIYIFQPRNTEDADYHAMKTYLSLAHEISSMRSLNENKSGKLQIAIPVIFEISSVKIKDAVLCYELGGFVDSRYDRGYYTQTICEDRDLGRIYGQIALMPDLAESINGMLSMNGSRLLEVELEKHNESIDNEINALEYAIPLYDHKDEDGDLYRVYLSSEEYLSHESYDLEKDEETNKSFTLYKYKPDFSFDTHKIIIIGFNNKVESILDCFAAHNKANPNNKIYVHFVVTRQFEFETRRIINSDKYKGLFNREPLVVINSCYDYDDYADLIDSDLHSILVLSNDEFDENKKDKNVFETWITIAGMANSNDDFSNNIEDRIVLEIKDSKNIELLNDELGRKIIVSNSFISYFMEQLEENCSAYDIVMDMLCSEKEAFSKELDFNECDLKTIRADKLFGVDEDREYKNKRDFIKSVYAGTQKSLLPIGIVRGGTTYLFTNGKDFDAKEAELPERPALSNCILVSEKEEISWPLSEVLQVSSDDYIVVVCKRAHK